MVVMVGATTTTNLRYLLVDIAGLDAKGGFGGGQIGYNWQAPGSRVVLGVEADLQRSGVSASRTTTDILSISRKLSIEIQPGLVRHGAWSRWIRLQHIADLFHRRFGFWGNRQPFAFDGFFGGP